jgi:hypothetical protein
MSEPGEISALDMSAATDAMARLTAEGRGWLDITPAGVDPPPPTSVWGRINGRGPTTPRLTWTAPRAGRRTPEPAAIGIEHASGPKALNRLALAGHPLPGRWHRLQDHPMRGLVVQPPADAPPEEVLGWALRAVTILGAPDAERWTVRVLGVPLDL